MRFPACCFLAALCGACGSDAQPATSPPPSQPKRPNVLMIVVDTLRADRLGAYGHTADTSPHLDALAADGMLVPKALSVAPWTTPSIAALMTSRHPTALGIESEKARVADEVVLLAEVLQDAGYTTGAAVSHSFCSSTWGFGQGFEGFDETNVKGHAALTTEGVTARGKSFLNEVADQDQPWMLWLHYFDPHCAYVEDPRFPYGGRGDYDGPVHSGQLYRDILKQWRKYRADDWAEMRRLYDSEIARTDAGIGALLAHLDGLGLTADTLIVVTADHGEEFEDHGGIGHAKTLYREVLHVPLLLRFPSSFPRFANGQPSPPQHWVSLLDVAPTVLDVSGLEAPDGFTGRSLLTGGPALPVFGRTHRAKGQRTIIDGDFKLIRWDKSGRTELYDLSVDPLEQDNLALDPGNAGTVERLYETLRVHTAEIEAMAISAPEIAGDAMDDNRLLDLGYAGAEDEQ